MDPVSCPCPLSQVAYANRKRLMISNDSLIQAPSATKPDTNPTRENHFWQVRTCPSKTREDRLQGFPIGKEADQTSKHMPNK